MAGSDRPTGQPAASAARLWETLLKPHGADWLQSGTRHYGKGWRTRDWSLGCYWDGHGDAAGTVFVEARQSALDRMPPDARLALIAAIRTRRLDLALDDSAVHARPRDLFHAAAEARSRTHKSKWRLEMTDLGAMTTLYVGSRASGRMLRIYDKRTPDAFVVRHELELKGDAALDAAELLAAGWPTEPVYWAEYLRVASWPRLDGWRALRSA